MLLVLVRGISKLHKLVRLSWRCVTHMSEVGRTKFKHILLIYRGQRSKLASVLLVWVVTWPWLEGFQNYLAQVFATWGWYVFIDLNGQTVLINFLSEAIWLWLLKFYLKHCIVSFCEHCLNYAPCFVLMINLLHVTCLSEQLCSEEHFRAIMAILLDLFRLSSGPQ